MKFFTIKKLAHHWEASLSPGTFFTTEKLLHYCGAFYHWKAFLPLYCFLATVQFPYLCEASLLPGSFLPLGSFLTTGKLPYYWEAHYHREVSLPLGGEFFLTTENFLTTVHWEACSPLRSFLINVKLPYYREASLIPRSSFTTGKHPYHWEVGSFLTTGKLPYHLKFYFSTWGASLQLGGFPTTGKLLFIFKLDVHVYGIPSLPANSFLQNIFFRTFPGIKLKEKFAGTLENLEYSLLKDKYVCYDNPVLFTFSQIVVSWVNYHKS